MGAFYRSPTHLDYTYHRKKRFCTRTRLVFQHVRRLNRFVSNNLNSFPPIVINVTDGEPDNVDSAVAEAKKLAQLKTHDGSTIIMNAHIATALAGKIELPNSNTSFSSNKFANFLFDISTVLPDALANRARDLGFNVQSGSRGFVFNADAETLIKILNFGTFVALR